MSLNFDVIMFRVKSSPASPASPSPEPTENIKQRTLFEVRLKWSPPALGTCVFYPHETESDQNPIMYLCGNKEERA